MIDDVGDSHTVRVVSDIYITTISGKSYIFAYYIDMYNEAWLNMSGAFGRNFRKHISFSHTKPKP